MRIEATQSDWTVEKDGKETKNKGGTVSADFDFGPDLKSLVAKFGEGPIYKQTLQALTVSAQGGLRSQFKQGKKQAEIDAWARDWKPGERKQGKSPREKLLEQMASMTPEERAKLLEEAKARATQPAKAPAAAQGKSGKKAA